MATNHFFKFDGIDGESTTKDHKGQVDVLSWTWGLSSDAGSPSPGGGGAVAKANFQDLTFVHNYDKASPGLALAAASGKHIKQAVLGSRRAGEAQKDFLVVTLKDAVITSVQVSASDDGISEQVSVRANAITFEYRPMDSKGALGDKVVFNWDLGKNSKA